MMGNAVQFHLYIDIQYSFKCKPMWDVNQIKKFNLEYIINSISFQLLNYLFSIVSMVLAFVNEDITVIC